MEATAKKKKPKNHQPANRLPRAKSANHIEAMDPDTAGEIGRMVSTQLVVGNWEGIDRQEDVFGVHVCAWHRLTEKDEPCPPNWQTIAWQVF